MSADREALIDRALSTGGFDAQGALQLSLQVQRALAVMARLPLLVIVIVLQVVIARTPESLAHRVIAQSGPLAWVPMWALCAVAVVGLLDLVVNDLMPERFTLPTALQHREYVFAALGLGCASVAFLMAKATLGWAVMVLYVTIAAFAGVMSVIDLIARKGGHGQ